MLIAIIKKKQEAYLTYFSKVVTYKSEDVNFHFDLSKQSWPL